MVKVDILPLPATELLWRTDQRSRAVAQLTFIRQNPASFQTGQRSSRAACAVTRVPRKYRYLLKPGCTLTIPVYNFCMRCMLSLLAAAAFAASLCAEQKPPPMLPCPPG